MYEGSETMMGTLDLSPAHDPFRLVYGVRVSPMVLGGTAAVRGRRCTVVAPYAHTHTGRHRPPLADPHSSGCEPPNSAPDLGPSPLGWASDPTAMTSMIMERPLERPTIIGRGLQLAALSPRGAMVDTRAARGSVHSVSAARPCGDQGRSSTPWPVQARTTRPDPPQSALSHKPSSLCAQRNTLVVIFILGRRIWPRMQWKAR